MPKTSKLAEYVHSSTGRLDLTVIQKFCREALIWKNLDHDYVLPFLGVDSESFPGFLCMISPWMHKGPIVTDKGGPDTDRIPFLVCPTYRNIKHIIDVAQDV